MTDALSRRDTPRDDTRDPGRVGAGLFGAGLKKHLAEQQTTFAREKQRPDCRHCGCSQTSCDTKRWLSGRPRCPSCAHAPGEPTT